MIISMNSSTRSGIFSTCFSSTWKAAPPLPVQRNRSQFREYVKANDLGGIEPFYSAYPRATVLDIQAALGEI